MTVNKTRTIDVVEINKLSISSYCTCVSLKYVILRQNYFRSKNEKDQGNYR